MMSVDEVGVDEEKEATFLASLLETTENDENDDDTTALAPGTNDDSSLEALEAEHPLEWPLMPFYKHQWMDCLDTAKRYLEAQVIEWDPAEPMKIKLHYKGWASKYDEWLDCGLADHRARLAQLHTHTPRPKREEFEVCPRAEMKVCQSCHPSCLNIENEAARSNTLNLSFMLTTPPAWVEFDIDR